MSSASQTEQARDHVRDLGSGLGSDRTDKRINVGVIGGTGYTGVELLRLLAQHPLADVSVITSRAEAGIPVAQHFPSLRGFYDLTFQAPEAGVFEQCDVVFSATPNGVAMQHAPTLIESGKLFIDLAADFRIQDIELWQKWYQMTHECPELVPSAAYGLPELFRQDIVDSKLVANPGCYPTASILALAPLLSLGLVDPSDIIIDAKSGVTGAGRAANVASLFSEVSDSFKAYGASGHRHHPEIQQVLQRLNSHSDALVNLTFIPHLVPMLRGIHATVYAQEIEPLRPLEEVHQSYVDFYKGKPFVDVLPLGEHAETRTVKSCNSCRIALHRASGSNKLVVLSVIDNLVKGAAGQAIQNMNVALGVEETFGLEAPSVLP